MNTFEEDKKLKHLLKSVKLNSPESGFSMRIMNRIIKEQPVLERVKNEPVLGKEFWIIVALFGALITAIALLSSDTAPDITHSTILSKVNSDNVLTGYRAFLEKLNNLPTGFSGIFFASSILIFLEKFLGSSKYKSMHLNV